jgi:glycosyltransferase involved in cell wall biosynthesis
MPRIGYQEVCLARTFARLGHDVHVITSNKPSPSVKNLSLPDYPIGIEIEAAEHYKCQIHRLKSFIAVRGIVLSKGVRKTVKSINPDLVLVLGVGKIFPWSLFQDRGKRNYVLFTLFGDNSDFYHWTTVDQKIKSMTSMFIQKIFKNYFYASAVKSSDRVISYTPETERIISSYLTSNLKTILINKIFSSTLGFDPDEFYFSSDERHQGRRMLNIAEKDIVAVTSTRVTRQKNLENIIDVFSKLHEKGINVHYVIIGFLNDEYGNELRKYIATKQCNNLFHCLGFQSHDDIRKFYSASDMGIWTQASISIQEAMGTGLPVIIPHKENVSHLVTDGKNGWYFQSENVMAVIKNAIEYYSGKPLASRLESRREIHRVNRENLSYDEIAKGMIASVGLT